MNKVSDYILDNDLEDSVFISLYGEGFFRPKDENDLDNWCFRGDTMILTPNGNVPISELKDGDKVVSGNGEIRPITVMKRMANDGVSQSRSIVTSLNPLWVFIFVFTFISNI